MTTLGTRLIDELWPVFDAEGALSTVSYRSITEGSVTSTDLITGGLTASGSTTTTGIKVIFKDFRSFEIDGVRVVQGDRRARFPKTVLSVTPTNKDQLVLGTTTYRVINVSEPVDGSSWDLHLRTP